MAILAMRNRHSLNTSIKLQTEHKTHFITNRALQTLRIYYFQAMIVYITAIIIYVLTCFSGVHIFGNSYIHLYSSTSTGILQTHNWSSSQWA